MKKRISLLVAIVMLFSSVAAYAVSDVEYAWYDEDDSKFYVFGTYANDTVGSGAYRVSDVGVYVNGEKFTYLQDGAGTSIVNTATGKFGFEFTGSPSEFKVQPYTTNSYGEHKGYEEEIDLTADNLGNEIKVSDNAKLANVFIYRDIAANVNVLTGMYPAFDPEVEEYEVYGYFGAANATMSSVEMFFETQAQGATVSVVDDFTSWNSGNGAAEYGMLNGEYCNKKIVTVTAADGVTTETYIFNINTNNIYKNDAQNVSYMTLNSGYNVEVNGANVTKSAAPAAGAALTVKPSVGATYNKYAVMTFPITANMATTDNIALNMRATNINYANGFKNLTISAREFDATDNTVGDIHGSFTVPDTTELKNATSSYSNCNIFIDVTSLVKKAIEAGQTSVDIAVQITDAEANGCSVVPSWGITYTASSYTNNYRPVLLVK